MALIGCEAETERDTCGAMDATPWQIRLRASGLTQRRLARLIDRPENTISRQLRGEFGKVSGDLVAIIMAWEAMPVTERDDWYDAVVAELERREKR